MMSRKISIISFFLLLLFLVETVALATTVVNMLMPYDTLLRPNFDGKLPYQTAFFIESGFHQGKGFNDDGDSVDVLQIWQKEQNALAMLEGFPPDSPISQLKNRINAADDGVRGHIEMTGKLKLNWAGALAARFVFARDFSVGVYFPFYQMRLKDFMFKDKTQNVTDADRRVKALLTDNLVENVKELGGLELGDWKRTGAGDLTVLIEWFRDFAQNKPFLKSARVNWRCGVMFPTSRREDDDKLFAVPFGNDGAFALPFGLGLDLTLGLKFKLGADIQLTHIINTTRTKRIKVDENQTELLLLAKAQLHRDFGLVQRFNLYAELYRIIKGLSFKVGYQFYKHGDDEIGLKTNTFSNEIANSAQRLQEFTMHHVITKTTYDFGVRGRDRLVRPELALFTRHPFNGKNVALVPTVGFIFSLDF